MKYIVALTGGIGSGKSTVSSIFSQLGVSVVDSDIIARQIVGLNTPTLKSIALHFGRSVLNHDGMLNRHALRKCIFTNPAEKSWIDNLLHSLIYRESQYQILQTKSPYVLWVVPLLVENQLACKANRVLVVDVSPQTQIQRTIARDNVSRQEAENVFNTQATREARLAIADDIIINDNKSNNIISEVIQLHKRYMMFAAQTIS